MATYICPGSPSEVNLPSCIRDRLLDIVSEMVSSPSPEQLTSAINHAYEILTEGVLVPFVRSFHLSKNHDIDTECIPKSTLSDLDYGQSFLRTVSSPRRDNMYEKSI